MADTAYSMVGLRAAEYAALDDDSVRRDLLKVLLARQPSDAISLAGEHNWWRDLYELLDQSEDRKGLVLAIVSALGPRLADEPELLALSLRTLPDRTVYAIIRDATDSQLLRLVDAIQETHLASSTAPAIYGLLRILLDRDLMDPVEVAGLANESHVVGSQLDELDPYDPYYELLPLLLKRLPIIDAMETLWEAMKSVDLAHTYASYGVALTPDFTRGPFQRWSECADIVVSRLPLPEALRWATELLVEAYRRDAQRYGMEFRGSEMSGTGHSQLSGAFFYQDNAWTINVLVPLYRRLFEDLGDEASSGMIEQAARKQTGAANPAFRLRAMILAAPEAALSRGELIQGLFSLRDGIPSARDTLARRARESEGLAHEYLMWLKAEHQSLQSPDEAAAMHLLLRGQRYREFAARLARDLVTDDSFEQREAFQLGFFAQLDWYEEEPLLAFELVDAALETGFRQPSIFDDRYLIRIIQAGLRDERSRPKVISAKHIARLLPYALNLADPADDALALGMFPDLDVAGRVELARRAVEGSDDFAVRLLSQALADVHPSATDSVVTEFSEEKSGTIYGVRVWGYLGFAELERADRNDAVAKLVPAVESALALERHAFGLHHALVAVSVLYNLAIKRDDMHGALSVVRFALATSERVIESDLERIADLAKLFWTKLEPVDKEFFWRVLGETRVAFFTRLDNVLFRRDEAGFDFLTSALDASSKARWRDVAWLIWRRLDNDGKYDIDAEAARIIDYMAIDSRADLATLVRGIAFIVNRKPEIGGPLFAKVLRTAVDTNRPFYLDADDDLSAALGRREVIEIATSLKNCQDPGYFGIVKNVAHALSKIVVPELSSLVREAFEGLREWPVAQESYRQWLIRVAR